MADATPASIFWSITVRYVVALTLIVGASLLAWTNLHAVVDQERSTAAVVNISGKQRMLSQRIALFSSRLASSIAETEKEVLREKLSRTIEEMARNHRALIDGSDDMGLPPLTSPAIEALYFDDERSLDADVEAYLAAARDIAKSKERISPDDPNLSYMLAVGPGPLLSALNDVVLQFQREGEQSVDRIKRTENIILMLTLILIAIEAAFIFSPMALKMRSLVAELIDERAKSDRTATQFQRIFAMAPQGMALVDSESRWLMTNPELSRLTGYDEDELRSVSIQAMMLPEDAGIVDGAFERMKRDPSLIERHECRFVSKAKAVHWVDVSLAPVADQQGQIVHWIAQVVDLTERHRTETRLRKVEQLEAQSQMTRGVAHEFNNRLAVITGNLQLLESLDHRNQRASKHIRKALGQAEGCADLVKQLLAYVGEQALASDRVDVEDLLRGLEPTVRTSLDEGITCRIAADGDIWAVTADREELQTAILALVDNAKKAMRDGGDLRLAAENIGVAGHQTLRDGDYVVLSVADSGVGIPDELKDKVLQPFFTTRDVGEGTGLGLSMVQGFLRQIGGGLSIDDRPEGGTVIKLFLPRRAEEAEIAALFAMAADDDISPSERMAS